MMNVKTGSSKRRLAIAGMAGNVLEWYDFSVYGFFAPAIAENFFPSRNEANSLIEAFGVFAAGFLVRPLGALVFGHLGDRRGREKALSLSVAAMAVPTFLMGLLPTYKEIGVAAPILMVLLRLVQGLSVGGEYTTSVVFLIERSVTARRGMMGALGSSGAFAGVMLGSLVGTVLAECMPLPALLAWGWRIPFLVGITIGVAGYFLRRELRDVAEVPRATPMPFGDLLRSQWKKILQVAGFKILSAVGFYLMFVYATTYLTEVVGLEKGHAMAINTLGMAIALVALPIAGALSDWIGRKPVLLLAAAGTLLASWPLFDLLWHPLHSVPFIGQFGFALLIALFDGASSAAAAEAFPGSVRCSAVALSHNLCMALLGGTTPMIAAFLIERTENEMIPPLLLMTAAAISAVFILTLQETAAAPLPD